MCLLVVHSLLWIAYSSCSPTILIGVFVFLKYTFNFCFLHISSKNLDLSHGCESIVFFYKVYGSSFYLQVQNLLLLFWYAARWGQGSTPCLPSLPLYPAPYFPLPIELTWSLSQKSMEWSISGPSFYFTDVCSIHIIWYFFTLSFY